MASFLLHTCIILRILLLYLLSDKVLCLSLPRTFALNEPFIYKSFTPITFISAGHKLNFIHSLDAARLRTSKTRERERNDITYTVSRAVKMTNFPPPTTHTRASYLCGSNERRTERYFQWVVSKDVRYSSSGWAQNWRSVAIPPPTYPALHPHLPHPSIMSVRQVCQCVYTHM